MEFREPDTPFRLVAFVSDHHTAPPIVPRTGYRERLHERRQLRSRVDEKLCAYWAYLVAQSEPLAEAILEQALKEAALQGTLFV
jgi:hypothetical protein